MNHQTNDVVNCILSYFIRLDLIMFSKTNKKFKKYSTMNGHLNVLKWARENGCNWDSCTCAYAAKNGHLSILKWARGNDGDLCDWNSCTCAYAALNGYLDILKWMGAAKRKWL